MQKAKNIRLDDSTHKELKDIKEFYANKSNHKVSSLKHLLKELKE